MRDEISSDEIGSDAPARSASPRVRRAVLGVGLVVAAAAYGPNVLNNDSPQPAPAAAPAPSESPHAAGPSAPPLPSSYQSGWSTLDVDSWPTRGDLARDASFRQDVRRRLAPLKLTDPQTLWAGRVPGGRLALVALRLDTSVEVHAAYFPDATATAAPSAAPLRTGSASAPLDFVGYLGRGWPRVIGWVGPSTSRGRPLVLVGTPESQSLRVSARVDYAEDGTATRRWRRHESGSGASVLLLDEPVSDPIVVCRAGGVRALIVRFDPRPAWAGGTPAPVGVRACGTSSGLSP